MNMKHTPGPWKIGRHPNNIIGVIDGSEEIVATVDFMPCVGGCGDVAAQRGADMEAANVRLIAKSPEMLDMLIQLRKEFAGLPHSLGYEFTHLPKLDALIAEATGEQA